MALFKYFKRECEQNNLPDPSGPLSKVVPSTSIEEANKEVATRIAESDGKSGKCVPYMV